MEQSARVDQIHRTDRVALQQRLVSTAPAMRFAFSLCLCVSCLLFGKNPAIGQEAERSAATNSATLSNPTAPSNPNLEIHHDNESFITTLKINTKQGRLAWRDLLAGLAMTRGFDEAELTDMLPEASFPIGHKWAQFSILAMNKIGKPYISFGISAIPKSKEKTLEVSLNRVVLLESKRRFKRRIKAMITMADFRKSKPSFGISRPEALTKKSRQLVISIHGYNAFAEDLDDVMNPIERHKIPCGRFSYPNDQPITESARLLSRELRKLREEYPQLKVSLISHSMGGLVARRVLEDKTLNPGNVNRLIMIAPPNHGSELAQFAFAMDLWQLMGNRRRREDLSFFYTSIEDGLAEAATDLQPNSIFLIKLNQSQRNPNVDYTIFLGNRAPLGHEDVNDLRSRIKSVGSRSRWMRFFGAKVDSMVDDLDELVDGQGDGVVSLESGRLDGVEDVIELPFSHTSILKDSKSESAIKLRDEIVQRIVDKAPKR